MIEIRRSVVGPRFSQGLGANGELADVNQLTNVWSLISAVTKFWCFQFEWTNAQPFILVLTNASTFSIEITYASNHYPSSVFVLFVYLFLPTSKVRHFDRKCPRAFEKKGEFNISPSFRDSIAQSNPQLIPVPAHRFGNGPHSAFVRVLISL